METQSSAAREARLSGATDNPLDGRHPAERDRDRIIYSDYFRRLSGVTQVASASDGGVFHNRQTHSLKVAQVGRRLAERILRNHPKLTPLLNPDVVEAASLAHDLGHPPFGHVAERELNSLATTEYGLEDGFEGNAQTFRIVSRLSLHAGGTNGLDLTRATLNATLKYPWYRARGAELAKHAKRAKKYSVYDDDREAFEFARAGFEQDNLSLEAQVMDLADSITYSIHDLEDFQRAGLIPLERIVRNDSYRQSFMDRWKQAEPDSAAQQYFQISKSFMGIKSLLEYSLSDDVEPGSQAELEVLEKFRSAAITKFLNGVEVNADPASPGVNLPEELDHQCKFLHRLVRDYVISNPRLATQQAGQIEVVKALLKFFIQLLSKGRHEALPSRFRQRGCALLVPKPLDDNTSAIHRFAVDIVASLSEAEAVLIFKRITGQDFGSLLESM
jgi:dGTPase